MRGLHAWCVLGGLAASACITVPPHQGAPIDAPVDAACGTSALDCDDDGWPAMALNALAHDCDDHNPDINPGASDDPGTSANEDCIADGEGQRLAGVTGGAAGWTSGAMQIGFGSMTRMPMSLRIGGIESLSSAVSGCETPAEEGVGVSLFPAFAAHLRTEEPGSLVVERSGPAMATSLVRWTVTVPATGAQSCDVETTLAGNIRFTVLPGQRLIREDLFTVDAASSVMMCEGCGIARTPPILSSYLALLGSYNRMHLISAPAGMNTDRDLADITLPGGGHRVCVRQGGGNGHVAMSWQTTGNDVRLRRTPYGVAVVYDWVFRGNVVNAAHRAITTMIVDARSVDSCDADLLDTLSEATTPLTIDGLTYEPSLGVYQPTDPVDGVVSFEAFATIERGFALRMTGLGDRGVTVWRDPTDGAAVRLVRDWNYLVQRDPDGATVIYLPAMLVGDRITIAGPGHEPAP